MSYSGIDVSSTCKVFLLVNAANYEDDHKQNNM